MPANHSFDDLTVELLAALGGMRHAYTQLKAGTVKDQQKFADGLIAPAIRCIENALNMHTYVER